MGGLAHTSKKQVMHALSTAEAEYMAILACAQEGLWIKSFLCSLHQPLPLLLRIHTDNTAVISLATTPSNCSNARHISTCFHFICKHVAGRIFELAWTPTYCNTADVLMKALKHCTFINHRIALSLVSH